MTLQYFIYISIRLNTYCVKFEIIVSYKCTNGNIQIFIRALLPTARNGPQRVFRTHFERGNVFKMEAGEPKKQNIP